MIPIWVYGAQAGDLGTNILWLSSKRVFDDVFWGVGTVIHKNEPQSLVFLCGFCTKIADHRTRDIQGPHLSQGHLLMSNSLIPSTSGWVEIQYRPKMFLLHTCWIYSCGINMSPKLLKIQSAVSQTIPYKSWKDLQNLNQSINYIPQKISRISLNKISRRYQGSGPARAWPQKMTSAGFNKCHVLLIFVG